MKFFYVFVIVLGILFDGGESSHFGRSNLDSLELALEVYESNKVPLERSAVDSMALDTKQNYLRDLISQARTELRQLSVISDRSSADDSDVGVVVQNRGNSISQQAQVPAVRPSAEVTQYYAEVKDRIEARIRARRARTGFRLGRIIFHDDSLAKISQRGLRKDAPNGIFYNLAVNIRLDGRLHRCEFTVNHIIEKRLYRNIVTNVLLDLMCRDAQDRNGNRAGVNYPSLNEEMRDM